MFQIDMTDGVAVLIATKRIEGRSRADARRQVDQLLESGTTRLVLDLSLVDRIDSSGLASVVAAFRRARSMNGDLYVCGLTERVQAIFELTLLNDVIPIFSSREEAVEAAKK